MKRSNGIQNIGIRIEKLSVSVFYLLVLLLFFILSYYSIGKTYVNSTNLATEMVYGVEDNLLLNLLYCGVVLLIAGGILKCYDLSRNRVKLQFLAAFTVVIAIGTSILWLFMSKTAPVVDQLRVVEYASAFNRGDFSALERGEYVGKNPQQLGMITVLRLCFVLFGDKNYLPFQLMSAVCVGVLIAAGYGVLTYLGDEDSKLLYLLCMLTCIPLYIYVPFVYGEIPSTALLMVCAWLLLRGMRVGGWQNLLGVALSAGLAVQLRRNSLIILIGFGIVLLVRLIATRDRRIGFLCLAMLLGILLFQAGIKLLYLNKIPEDSKGMPASLYISMGLNENYGWYDFSHDVIFRDTGGDVEASDRIAKDRIRQFILRCRQNPGFATSFFTEKMNMQWNAPMYHAITMNGNIVGEQGAIARSVYHGRLWQVFNFYTNTYQLLVYGGIFGLLIIRKREWRTLEPFLLLVGIYGGFLFTLIWETKTRYTLPYFLLMLPYGAMGIAALSRKVFPGRKNI